MVLEDGPGARDVPGLGTTDGQDRALGAREGKLTPRNRGMARLAFAGVGGAMLTALAANTSTIALATGIANIYARDAMAMNASRNALDELSGGRLILGHKAPRAGLDILACFYKGWRIGNDNVEFFVF